MQSCQNFNQKFSFFLILTEIVQEQKMLQKQKMPNLKVLISGYEYFDGKVCNFDRDSQNRAFHVKCSYFLP